MIEVNSPEISVDEIMEKIRKEVARRRSNLAEPAKPSPSRDVPEAEPLKPVLLPRLSSHPQFEIKGDGYHVNDFLQFHDRDFIINSYKGLLKRDPDNDGLSNYLDQLRQGIHSKIEILGRLRYSPEGKTKKVNVKGLLFPLGVAQTYKIPLLGYLVRLATAMIRLPTIVRNQAQFQQHMMGVHKQLQEYLNNVAGSIENAFVRHAERIVELESQKADRSEVTPQGESVRSLEGRLAQILDTMQELKHNKAEQSGITFLAGAIGTLEGRLSEIRTTVEELKNSKAKQSEITSLIETVRSVEGRLGEMQAAAEVLESSKADLSEVTSLGEVIETMEAKLDQLLNTIKQLEGRKAEQSQVMSNAESIKTLKDTLSELQAAMNELKASKAKNEDIVLVGERLSAFQENLTDLRSSIADLERIYDQKANKDELIAFGDQKATKDETAQIRVELTEMMRQLRDHKLNILDQQRQLTLLLEEARKRLPEPISTEQVQNMVKEEDHMLDAMYVSFEDQFRGTREDIKHTQKIYLPYIQKVGAGTKDAPILDVGCGRGEWLELLKEKGLGALGLDLNRVLIEKCKGRGIEVVEGDVNNYLSTIPDDSLGALTAFHLIEHLSFKTLIRLIDETLRVLKPSGIAIFETPNPQNVLVGSCNFYLDPTHKNPLPSSTMKFLLESRGFCRIEIINLHPLPEAFRQSDSEIAEQFNKYFYGPQDYAILGRKL